MFFFSWLRTQARDAVLGGIADAMEELEPGAPAPDLDAVRKRLAAGGGPKALAAATADEEAEVPKKGRGK